ncbi:hypothetical protein Vretimale_431 [Volvox reticuliferus]|uniref:Threonylcarbamoyl-AMP synthase n=1 Tax=Volvox reticuliferus TaxID=1737510 RepID=A0A8J4FDY2_9CHLO|nr:hypothetical protein Vretifemale_2644 [Volvox reticuliferus]GIL94096.1 hypothetical protein Vretimale_431 [Volvox reticuliferus]
MAWKIRQDTAGHILNPAGRAWNLKSFDAIKPNYGFGWTYQRSPCSSQKSRNLGIETSTEASGRRKVTAMAAATPLSHGGLQTQVICVATNGFSCDAAIPSVSNPLHPGISQAAALLAAGQVVAIPTETVYGLAANALSAAAVRRVYAAKNRPADNPLIVHVSSLEMLASLYPPGWVLPSAYEAVVSDLWPGPLTILLPRSNLVPDVVTCGQSTMAVRMPAHPVALALIATCGFPLAAPSANSSGRPSPTLARHVLDDLGGRVSLILDGGPCTCGVESTVLDGLRNPPAILRPGGITREQLAGYPGLAELLLYHRDFVDPQLEAAPSTPGMKYRHYSPSAPVILLDPGDAPLASVSDEELMARLQRGVEGLLAEFSEHGLQATVTNDNNGVLRLEELQLGKGRGSNRDSNPWNEGPKLVGLLRTSLLGLPPGPLQGATMTPPSLPPPGQSNCTSGGFPIVLPPCKQQPAMPSQSTPTARVVIETDFVTGSAPGGGVGEPNLLNQDALDMEEHRNPMTVIEPHTRYEYVLGHVSRPAEVASELFAALRHMDEVGVAVIVVEGVRDAGTGVAVMNRLRKAASRIMAV